MSEALRASKHYGYEAPSHIPFNYAAFKSKRDANIAGLNRGYESNWAREGITLVRGTAKFTASKTIAVALEDGSGVETFKAETYLYSYRWKTYCARDSWGAVWDY
ncbi:hypothetical protein EYC80_004220 [Monilinia laxa]|uniref:Uncharacterized protein n=1 Tax=Monilinia laxa TaxID=61186 RepID=A0A5N6KMJ5_MONLA|nr:hypothetical protein EYC80_004220 [Monilinia laxa]